MKSVWLLLIVGLLGVVVGCNDDDVEYNWPADIYGLCEKGLEDAKNCIQSKGTKLKERWSCSAVKNMTCDKRASSGYWCWYDAQWKMYVGGLYRVRKIEVGCNPRTGGEVHPGVITHELGHHWLISNEASSGHDAKYRDCFINWNAPAAKVFLASAKTYEDVMRQARVAYLGGRDGDWISVSGFDASNQFFHIDFVVIRDEPGVTTNNR